MTTNEPRTSRDIDAAKPLQLRRRVKRGIVASYIHELSERHGRARDPERPDEAVEPQRAA